MPESDFTCHDIMHFYMSFHALALKGGSSYTELSEWIPQNKHDEECFKWTVQWHIQGCWQGWLVTFLKDLEKFMSFLAVEGFLC